MHVCMHLCMYAYRRTRSAQDLLIFPRRASMGMHTAVTQGLNKTAVKGDVRVRGHGSIALETLVPAGRAEKRFTSAMVAGMSLAHAACVHTYILRAFPNPQTPWP